MFLFKHDLYILSFQYNIIRILLTCILAPASPSSPPSSSSPSSSSSPHERDAIWAYDIYSWSSCSAPLRSVIAPRQKVVTSCVSGSGLPSVSSSPFFFFSDSSNVCYELNILYSVRFCILKLVITYGKIFDHDLLSRVLFLQPNFVVGPRKNVTHPMSFEDKTVK